VENRIVDKREGIKQGVVLYWMSREQRVYDNWALLFGIKKAQQLNTHLEIVFTLAPQFLEATNRHYTFMIAGLKEIEATLAFYSIPFTILIGDPVESIEKHIQHTEYSCLITDMDPIRLKRTWQTNIFSKINIPYYLIDSHNVIPVNLVSTKAEYGAYTIRPKIYKQLSTFLINYPNELLNYQKGRISLKNNDNQQTYSKFLNNKIVSGETVAKQSLADFIDQKLTNYNLNQSNPSKNGTSQLSKHLHFGQISSQRILIDILRKGLPKETVDGFIEQLLVRKELTDNFCFYTKEYDRYEALPEWSRKSLDLHKEDPREFIYTLADFEAAKTHDELWNAAQRQMVNTGFMHNYMRMYWAKKILEWCSHPEDALNIAIYLNDKYLFDGRDPNGYVGIAWAIGGLHDRAWAERPIFGKVRYMNYNGCMRKFNVTEYISQNK